MFSILIRLIGRLSVSRKLILIYALDLTAVIFVSSILINEKFLAIDFVRKEIVGNTYISIVRDALFVPPQAMERKTSSLRELQSAEIKHGNGMDSRKLARDFVALLDAPEMSSRRLAIQTGQMLITRIGNQSNLILDPDLDSYYTMSLVVLRFPELFQLIEQIRNKTADLVLARAREPNRVQTDYLILEGQLDAIAKGIDADFSEAIAAGNSQ